MKGTMHTSTRSTASGFLIVGVTVLGCVWAGGAGAAPEPFAAWDATGLVSEKSCKLCHGKDKVGNQYAQWEKGPHANAMKRLATPEAKKVAKDAGVTDPEKSPKCLKCHSTAYGYTEKLVTEKVPIELGVTCQSCHGPAKTYKTKHKKASVDERKELGMVYPTEANNCRRCHNKTSPTNQSDRYTTKDGKKVDFDFEQAWGKTKHLLKK